MAKYRLDEMDLKILDILIEDARKPYIDVAKALDISSGTVNVRIRKMEELEIIKKFCHFSRLRENGIYFYCLCGYLFGAQSSS